MALSISCSILATMCTTGAGITAELSKAAVTESKTPQSSTEIGSLTKLIQTNPNDPELLKKRALAYLAIPDADMETVNKATDDASKAIEIDKNCWDAYRVRAMARIMSGNSAEALPDLTKIIDQRKATDDTYIVRARAYFHLKKYDESIADYTTALKTSNKPDFELARRAEVKLAAGDTDGAMSDADESIKKNSKGTAALIVRGQIRDNGDKTLPEYWLASYLVSRKGKN